MAAATGEDVQVKDFFVTSTSNRGRGMSSTRDVVENSIRGSENSDQYDDAADLEAPSTR